MTGLARKKVSRLMAAAAACATILLWTATPALAQVQPATRRATESSGAMLDRANHFIMQDRCAEAIPILERLTANDPRIAAANEMLAGCYLKEGRVGEAAAFLERCLRQEPGRYVYARDLGRAYLDLGRREDAVAVWRSLLGGDEKSVTMYGQVAKLEQEAGLYDEAIETLRAGAAFKATSEYYSREVIRLERVIGRDEDAFRDALLLIAKRRGALEPEVRTVAEVFGESKRQDRLVAILDSMSAAGDDTGGAFRTLRTIFLVDTGRYDEARSRLLDAGGPALREDEIYALLVYLQKRAPGGDAPRLASFREELMRLFLDRFGSSPFAPHVRLMAAESMRESALRASGAARDTLLAEALALCDAAKRTGVGSPYFDKASIMKARVYFEDMHREADALAELGNVGRRSADQRLEAEELRGRILLASGDAAAAAASLGRLASDADSNVAILGRYDLGRLAFLRGRYEESVKTLSDLAEKSPASPWANDALELAMDVKGALPEGRGALDLYRAAVLERSRGDGAAAIDSLGALERRYPESTLAPRAIFMKGEIEEESSAFDAARADYTRLAESRPLHELAPRALERLAELDAREDAAAAIARYGTLMERYPDYPFMERVRERYVALAKSAEAPAPEKGTK